MFSTDDRETLLSKLLIVRGNGRNSSPSLSICVYQRIVRRPSICKIPKGIETEKCDNNKFGVKVFIEIKLEREERQDEKKKEKQKKKNPATKTREGGKKGILH